MASLAFADVVEQGRAVQARLPDLGLIAVGGTAAALHCHHRYSLDVDQVSPKLQARYGQVAETLEAWPGWTTNRKNPPVLILGQRHGVELGVRQQRRKVPLQTTVVDGLIVPVAPEILRVKAYLMATRRAIRDYVDVAALGDYLGAGTACQALRWLNLLYEQRGSQTLLTQFAEASEAEPLDLRTTPLGTYKGLQPPFTDWSYVAESCRRLGREMLKRELAGSLPSALEKNSAGP